MNNKSDYQLFCNLHQGCTIKEGAYMGCTGKWFAGYLAIYQYDENHQYVIDAIAYKNARQLDLEVALQSFHAVQQVATEKDAWNDPAFKKAYDRALNQ